MDHGGVQQTYFRNFVFGVEDSLVSTVGLLSGVASANVATETILLTGIVLIFVEAFSMAAGSFLSEDAGDEFALKQEAALRKPSIAGVIMFFSYIIAGLVPLGPYVLFDVSQAFPVSILASLIALYCLGLIAGKVSRTSLLKNGIRMTVVGGLAIGVGVLVGQLLS